MKKTRILYILLLLFSLVFVYFYGGKVPYILFYIILLLPVISFLYTGFIYLRFKYSQEIENSIVTKGDKVKYTFYIKNEDILLYPYINVIFHGSKTIFDNQCDTIKLSLAPSHSKAYSFELECKYRGVYEVGIDTIEIEDFLGLFKFHYKSAEHKQIDVYPRIIPLQRFLLKNSFISESQSSINNRYEDNSTACDIREYHYGDNMRKIHWKLTSKMDSLMIRQFESTSEMSAVLLIDLVPIRFSAENRIIIEDKIAEAAVAVVHYCLYNWIPVNLLFYSDGLISISAPNQHMFPQVYEILAKIKFNQNIPAKSILDIYVNSNTTRTNIILITANLDYELCEELYKTNSSGYDPRLIYVSPEELLGYNNPDADNIITFLPEVGIEACKINISDDIRSILER